VLAASLFANVSASYASGTNRLSTPTTVGIDLVNALLDSNQLAAATDAMNQASRLATDHPTSSVDEKCRIATARAEVELANGHAEAARASVDDGIATGCRDSARAALLNVRGDVLARQGRAIDAENAWHEAADSIEAWRISLPSARLRSGLLARHRRSLESWLDSVAARGDAKAAAAVAQRMLGRAILERMLDREPETSSNTDALIGDVLGRIADSHRLAARIATSSNLETARVDLTAFLVGARSVWALRHAGEAWSVRRVGDRVAILVLVDDYERRPDDREVAARLGGALFPSESLPARDAPLVALLDDQLSGTLLAGLRVDGMYVIERNPIIEVPTPELLFEHPQSTPWTLPVVVGDPRGDLPGSSREADFVARALHVTALSHSNATRDALLASPHPRVLHIAAHSKVDDSRAAFVMADGIVTATQVLSAGLAPRLAVIATCRSQGGDDPMTSLVAAFLASGTVGVIGAKRALDDDAGELLLRDFYLAGGQNDPVQALALAQRSAIARSTPPHVWASLSYFGSSTLGEQSP
jgi:hypothetical protein